MGFNDSATSSTSANGKLVWVLLSPLPPTKSRREQVPARTGHLISETNRLQPSETGILF